MIKSKINYVAKSEIKWIHNHFRLYNNKIHFFCFGKQININHNRKHLMKSTNRFHSQYGHTGDYRIINPHDKPINLLFHNVQIARVQFPFKNQII